jgi:hypothetical protein
VIAFISSSPPQALKIGVLCGISSVIVAACRIPLVYGPGYCTFASIDFNCSASSKVEVELERLGDEALNH